MNKKVYLSFLLVVAALFSFTGIVAAQAPNPPEESPRNGYVHDILMSYAAEKLGLSVEVIESRIEAGETLAQIAFAEGFEDYYAFMQDAKTYVSAELAEQGITIPGWAKEGVRGNRAQNAQNVQNGQMGQMGQNGQFGTCDGTCMSETGEPLGRGFRGGR